jgi:HK97 family phage prohead protease
MKELERRSNSLETRTYSVQLESREEGDDGIITGRPIVYNSRTNLGLFDEEIAPGALNGTDLNDVRLCLNHDTSYVYARSRRNNPNSTMQLQPNEYGLDFTARLAVRESPKAQDYYTAVQRQDIDKMSFMFSVEDEEWRDLESDHPLRVITKIGTVVEVSAVTFPAYDSTEIQARSQQALDNARSALEKAREEQRAKPLDSGIELLKEKTKLF